jgi:hypothetical protein
MTNKQEGCFSGDSFIKTPTGLKQVRELKKGDIIINKDNTQVTVKCVVNIIYDKAIDVVTFNNGFIVTPFHPIRTEQQIYWSFTSTHYKMTKQYIYDLYDIVLEDGNYISILLNQDSYVDVVTLGHNIVDNCITYHEFFGTSKVLERLKEYSGWDTGYIRLYSHQFVKCWQTDMIIDLL